MTTSDRFELQVCLRPFAPEEVQHRQREIIDRIENLAAEGGHDASVVWWSPKVAMPDNDGPFADSVPQVVIDLMDCADHDGFSLEPFIEEHHSTGLVQQDVLVLPLVSLVVRVDGEVRGLYPVEIHGETYTIEDGLRALETGEDVTNLDELHAEE